MSGVWSNYWDWSKKRVGLGDDDNQGTKLGPARLKDTYYGNVSGQLLGEKNGRKKLLNSLKDQGAETKGGRVTRMPSASGQLLGGGGGG